MGVSAPPGGCRKGETGGTGQVFAGKPLKLPVLQPVEDLMLSSIHAFSVELRLASDSVLSKVK